MAQKQSQGAGKRRKKGDWVPIAAGRERSMREGKREIINGRGVSNVPVIGQVGSAAYRRLMDARKHHRAG